MTQVDDGGLIIGDVDLDDATADEKPGARRPEHGGQTSSLPKKEGDFRDDEEEDVGSKTTTQK